MKKPAIDPVHEAVMRRSLSDLLQALAEGAPVDAMDREGRTALLYAAKDGDMAIASALLRAGANVNARDKIARTPLHLAANSYQVEAAELLLTQGALVDAQDLHGNTPLFNAVFDSKGRDGLITRLLAAGADKTMKNKHGVSPETLARSIGNYDITPFLAG
jgi:ankyrin repeat protein